MPLYEYECKCGNTIEKTFKIAACPLLVKCNKCGKNAKKIISSNIIRDEPAWLKDSVNHLMPLGPDYKHRENRPTNRTELNRFLKKHNLAHVE